MSNSRHAARELAKDLLKRSDDAVLLMVERYWSFMLKNKQIYRLMNGMDGVPHSILGAHTTVPVVKRLKP
jgi:hypothetical protein